MPESALPPGYTTGNHDATRKTITARNALSPGLTHAPGADMSLVRVALGRSYGVSLVVLFFMHVWYRGRLVWVFLGAGVLWLAFLIAFTLSDVATRGWISVPPPWIAGASGQGGLSP